MNPEHKLMESPELSRQMSQDAATHAQRLFDINRQVQDYLKWFDELRAIYKRGMP